MTPFSSYLPLSLYERIFLVLLLSTFLFFAVLSYRGTSTEISAHAWTPHAMKALTVEVTIQGAVKYPGTYAIERGATVDDLLKKAIPLPEADLRRVKTTSKITQHKKITIPCKKSKKLKKGDKK